MKKYLIKSFLVLSISINCSNLWSQTNNILMFVSYQDTYYSEYIVMKEALESSGYSVDVRSSATGEVSIYMIAEGGEVNATIEGVANAMSGSDYMQFLSQFQDGFGSDWNETLNATPNSIAISERIQDVADMSDYDGLVVVGGTGALEYRVDGSYQAQGTVSATDVESAAEKLNTLAVQALLSGKPVMAQCHGASIPAYWRVPDTGGLAGGEEAIGYSLLKDGNATGFPEFNETDAYLDALGIDYRPEDRVTVSSPHSSLMDDGMGDYRILTTRDWYPQTVAHAARAFINIITTYPEPSTLEASISVLILHGGDVIENDCLYTNRDNDVPCNYGTEPENLPADYSDLQSLLNADSPIDTYNFNISEQDITDVSLPYDQHVEASITSYLSGFDVVIFYKHWSTGITDGLLNALVDYADNGGGVLALHHGLYNDNDNGQTKDILINQLFGAEASDQGWSGYLTNYAFFSTNYGHFISTYGVEYLDAAATPTIWNSNEPNESSNTSFATYQNFSVYDEIYNNMTFIDGQTFGREVNEITPLFSNDVAPASQSHTAGFVKLFDASGDGTIGRVAFFQAGERIETTNINHSYGQVIRNSVFWAAAPEPSPKVTWDGETSTAWSTAANWVGDVLPTNTSDVVIPNVANHPIITTDEVVASINIEANVVLIISSNSLSVNDVTTIDGSLTIASGASFIPLGSISGSGQATIDRNTTFDITEGRYSAIGSPVIAGSTSSLGSLIYWYDETIAYGEHGDDRFITVSSPETMTIGDAYFSANTGDISFTGMPNSGDIGISLVHSENQDGNTGFNLVSNPYTAAISYDDFVAENSDIDGTVYFWDDGGSNFGQRTNADYITANSMGATSGGDRSQDWDGYIRSTQGFFVKATTAGTLNFRPNMMSTENNSDNGFFRKTESEVFRFSLSSGTTYDDILIGFSENATESLDVAMDARKIQSDNSIQLYSKFEKHILAIQALPISNKQRIVNLGFDISEADNYVFRLEDKSSCHAEILLIDHLLNKEIKLSTSGFYEFHSGPIVDSDRFSLLFNSVQILSLDTDLMNNEMIVFSKNNTLNIKLNREVESANINIYDISGGLIQRAQRINFNQNEWSTQFEKNGLFVVVIETKGGIYRKKFFK